MATFFGEQYAHKCFTVSLRRANMISTSNSAIDGMGGPLKAETAVAASAAAAAPPPRPARRGVRSRSPTTHWEQVPPTAVLALFSSDGATCSQQIYAVCFLLTGTESAGERASERPTDRRDDHSPDISSAQLTSVSITHELALTNSLT